MMEEEFYASIKLVSGEEVFALVSASEEEDRTLLILDNPVIISPMEARDSSAPRPPLLAWPMRRSLPKAFMAGSTSSCTIRASAT